MTCAFCLKPAEGNFSIHRDGFGVGPEVDLCDACGGSETPSAGIIWGRIAQPRTHSFAYWRVTTTERAELHARGLPSADDRQRTADI